MVPIAIVFIVFVFVTMMVRMGQKFELDKAKLKYGDKTDSGVGLSELKALIRESIEESMEPMNERLRVIEKRLDRLPATNAAQPLLEVPGDEYAPEVAPSEVRLKEKARD